jgi:hypothetical protein
MTRFSSRSLANATLLFLGLGASTLLTGCFEKDGEDCTPKGGTCDTAATVVDLSATTGCGLALRLADSTYVVPIGSTWTNYAAKAGDKLVVGYSTKKRGASQGTCAAGPLVELGCVSADTTSAN